MLFLPIYICKYMYKRNRRENTKFVNAESLDFASKVVRRIKYFAMRMFGSSAIYTKLLYMALNKTLIYTMLI